VAGAWIRRFRDRYFPMGVSVWVTRDRMVLLRTARGGHVLSGRSLPWLSQDAVGQCAEVWHTIWGDLMKRKDLSKSKSALLHADPDGLAKTFPKLAEFMTAATFDGGKDRRDSPTVTIWAAGGTWRASVKDRAEGLVLWLAAPFIAELLSMLEDFVLSPEAPWRHDEQGHPRDGKRAKKGS